MSTRSQERGTAGRRSDVSFYQAFVLAFLLHVVPGGHPNGSASEAPSVQPVELRGAVTDYLTPSTGFFLQDEPSGIPTQSAASLQIRTGDLEEARGATNQGGYAPYPIQRRVETVGRASFALFNSASWWNRQRILFALTGLGGLMLLALAWSVALRRTVLNQTRQIRMQLDRESALDERFRQLFDGAIEGVFQTAPDGRFLTANPAMARILGLSSPGELIDSRTSLGRQTYVLPSRADEFKRRMEENGRVEGFEYEAYQVNGQKVWLSESARSVYDTNGHLVCYEGTIEDITTRKRAEEALRRSEAEARTLGMVASRTDNAVIITNASGYIQWVNDGFTRMTEYSRDEAVGRKPGGLLQGPESDPATIARMRQCLQEEYGFEVEIINRTRSGRSYWVAIEVQPVRDLTGALTHFIAIERDITERKSSETALQESEKRFRAIANYTYDWESWIGPEGNPVWINPAVERMTGYTVNECLGMNNFPAPLIHEQDRELVVALFRGNSSGVVGNDFTFRIRSKNGIATWAAVSWQPIFGADGKYLGVRTSVRDITERKQAEDALMEAERFTRATIDALPARMCVLDEEGTIMMVNQAWRGFANDHPALRHQLTIGSSYLTFWDSLSDASPGETARYRAGLESVISGEQNEFHHEYAFAALGQSRQFHAAATRFQRPGPVRVVVTHEDITRRKLAETELQRSEERFAKAFRTSPIAIAITTLAECRFLEVNEAFLDLMGYSSADVIHHTSAEMRMWARPEDHEQCIAGLRDRGYVRATEYDLRTKTGEIRHTLCSAELIELHGDPCVLTMVVDITKRKEAERALCRARGELEARVIKRTRELSEANDLLHESRERLINLSVRLMDVQEAQRREVARELHDEIGQVLTGLKLLLEMSVRMPAESSASTLAEAKALTDDLMHRVRQLSLDLRPQMLDDLGLLPALEWHFKRFTRQSQIQVHFETSGLDGRLSPQLETAVYRIIQEALTNVARHAETRDVFVRAHLKESYLHLEVIDHGVGFNTAAVLGAGATNGVSGMRERVSLLDGEFDIVSTKGSGTHLAVKLFAGKVGSPPKPLCILPI